MCSCSGESGGEATCDITPGEQVCLTVQKRVKVEDVWSDSSKRSLPIGKVKVRDVGLRTASRVTLPSNSGEQLTGERPSVKL